MEKTGVTGVWELRFERTGLSWDRAVDRLSLGIHPPEDTYCFTSTLGKSTINFLSRIYRTTFLEKLDDSKSWVET